MSKSTKIANTVLTAVLTILSLAWIYPVLMILLNSLKKETAISTGTAYTGAVPYEAPTNGTAQELNLKVDGKAVTASAVLAGGNYYVTADFLATLGVSL